MRAVVAAVLLALALSGCSSAGSSAPSAGDQDGDPTALPLPARWWVGAEQFPPDSNPVNDPTGAQCGGHQPSDVWFLAGTYGGTATRTCHVPSGRRVFAPVLDQICTVSDDQTVREASAACRTPDARTVATLDGRPLAVRPATSRGAFGFTAQPNSATGLAEGDHQAVTWGLWIGPLRVPPGRHVLRFAASSGSFGLGVTYRLTVG